MKILHCCLAAFYIDDFSYQENIFPRLHKEFGHDVEILASTETYIDRVRLGYTDPGLHVSRDGISVTRLPYVSWLPGKLVRKLRLYAGLKDHLERFKPDIVFLHDCQFLSITTIARYARRSGATVYVDSHTDFINSGRNFVSRYILHGLIYRFCAKVIEKQARKFYPTLPLRAEFLSEVYGIDKNKIEVLPFGVDDRRIDLTKRDAVRGEMRETLKISQNALVFIAGGKIDRRKGIHSLIEAFCRLVDVGDLPNTYLILFGRPEQVLREQIKAASKHRSVRYVDWLDAKEIYRYLWAADVAIFPGTHSVLWEEAVGLGLPCVFRRWEGIEHVNIGGNCVFLDVVNTSVLEELMLDIAHNPSMVAKMKNVATTLGPKVFSYSEIAKRAISDDDATRVFDVH